MAIIYLSSTYGDLKVHREAIYHALRQMRYDVIAMEDYVATDQRPLKKCLADVASCDLYIGLFAWRYGHMPSEENPEHKSITELEYRKAIQVGKPCLIFLLAEDAAWSPAFMDVWTGEGNRGEYITALRRELAHEKMVSFFKTPEHLASLVGPAVHLWENNRATMDNSTTPNLKQTKQSETAEREARLRAMLADHRGFLRDRLESFVGRQAELVEIRQCITEKLHTGGYVTITGQAGQGKSSVIAKLVEEYEPEEVTFHFIPFNPGPDHQVGLLRNLLARLILKYQLPEIYVASESRPALRDYFPKVLSEVAARGAEEVVFVDGLDQLEEDFNGIRDLSFLPLNPPPGIVFVLGTRPNDTLRPLELLKPHAEYKLPNLSRHDFDLILEHHHVQLKRDLADQFYQAMQENALYLDLVARELKEKGPLSSDDIIKRIANNPENLFSLSMDRFRRQRTEWREVIKPILGVLLAAREPLTKQHIRQILAIDADQLNEAMQRLGGLIADSGQQRYVLFHLKFLDYLRQDSSNPMKEYIFASDEEEGWHKTFWKWCEQSDLAAIWRDVNNDPIEQGRREYARQHYIAHLYYAREWQQLFQTLDTQQFGLAKVHLDSTMRSYSQDLDFGRLAIARGGWGQEEAISLLPHLWHYTWLRCSLGSRADKYPIGAFRILVLLGREREAQSLAEMLTEPLYKARILLEIAKLIGQRGRKQDSIQILLRASQVTEAVIESSDRSKLAAEQVKILVLAQQWEWAETTIRSIASGQLRVEELCELGTSLALAQQSEKAERVWEEAEKVISQIDESLPRLKALRELLKSYASVRQWEKIMVMTHLARSSNERIELLIESGRALALAQQLEKAEKVWKEVEGVLPTVEPDEARVGVMCRLSEALAQAGNLKGARVLWIKAEKMVDNIANAYGKLETRRKLRSTFLQILLESQQWEKAEAFIEAEKGNWQGMFMLQELGKALLRAQRWEQAENVTRMIELDIYRRKALLVLAEALAQAQQTQQAEKIWSEVESTLLNVEQDRGEAKTLSALAKALIQTQQWDQAEEVVDAIQDSNQRARALGELGKALAHASQWERGRTTANKIKESKVRIEVLNELGKALSLAHQRVQAKIIWDEITLEINDIVGEREKAEMWGDFVKALVHAHQWELAKKIIRKIPPDAEIPEHVPNLQVRSLRTRSLIELAEALTRAQQFERAEAIWTEVDTLIGSMESSVHKARDWLELAEALTRVQQFERAEAIWAKAEPIAGSKERSEVVMGISEALIRAQRWEQAKKVIHAIEDSALRTRALSELGKALAVAQQWEQAEAVARSIEPSYHKVTILQALAEALARAQQFEQAEAVWDEAESLPYAIKGSYQKAEALLGLVEALARAQRWKQAQVAWTEAESEARSVQDRPLRINLMIRLVETLARAQQWERAEAIMHSMQVGDEKAESSGKLAEILLASREYDRLLNLVQLSWLQVETTQYGVQLLPLSFGFIPLKPEIGILFHEAFKKVDTFFKVETF